MLSDTTQWYATQRLFARAAYTMAAIAVVGFVCLACARFAYVQAHSWQFLFSAAASIATFFWLGHSVELTTRARMVIHNPCIFELMDRDIRTHKYPRKRPRGTTEQANRENVPLWDYLVSNGVEYAADPTSTNRLFVGLVLDNSKKKIVEMTARAKTKHRVHHST